MGSRTPSRSRLAPRLYIPAGLAAAAVGVAVAVRRAEAALDAAEPLEEPHERVAPEGHALTITTDDGGSLSVGIVGPDDAPTVVLAHCWMGGRDIWAPVAHRLLRSGYRVVLYDQRGHGASVVGRDGYTIARLGDDLRAVLEAIDASDVVVAGHSMGGMTIQSLACEHPEVLRQRVRAIVLVSTAATGVGRSGLDRRGPDLLAGRVIERGLETPLGHWFVRGTFGASARRHHLELTRDLVVATDPPARGGWLTAMLAMDMRSGIASIDIPTTVMVGTRDALTPMARARELVDAIPHATLVSLDHHGHMLPLEAPAEVAEHIAALAAHLVVDLRSPSTAT